MCKFSYNPPADQRRFRFHISPAALFFILANSWTVATNLKPCEVHKGFFLGEKEEQKSPHFEEKKSHIAIFR
jgi:hypothetical protein